MSYINNVLHTTKIYSFYEAEFIIFFLLWIVFGDIFKDCWPKLVHKIFLRVYFKSFVGLDFKLCLWSILG